MRSPVPAALPLHIESTTTCKATSCGSMALTWHAQDWRYQVCRTSFAFPYLSTSNRVTWYPPGQKVQATGASRQVRSMPAIPTHWYNVTALPNPYTSATITWELASAKQYHEGFQHQSNNYHDDHQQEHSSFSRPVMQLQETPLYACFGPRL
jgi:hypothetical protein